MRLPLILALALLTAAYGLAWRNYSYDINKNEWEYLIGDGNMQSVKLTKQMAGFFESSKTRMKKHDPRYYSAIEFTGWESQRMYQTSFENIWEARIENGVESLKWWWF